jgi:hypothetical protein
MPTLNYRDVGFKEPIPEKDVLSKIVVVSHSCFVIYADGTIWSIKYGRYLSLDTDEDGYKIARLAGKTIKVHRLMLMVFDRKPKRNEQVRHLDGDPANNNLSNLVWGTGTENWVDRKLHGRGTEGEKHGRTNLTDNQVLQIRKDNRPKSVIAKEYRVHESTINSIQNNHSWKHLL